MPRIIFLDPFAKDYKNLPRDIQRTCDRAIKLLETDPRYPSLRVKKMAGTDIWEARTRSGYRITFRWHGDTVCLRRVGTHNILRNP